jgi:hypothetical protein
LSHGANTLVGDQGVMLSGVSEREKDHFIELESNHFVVFRVKKQE